MTAVDEPLPAAPVAPSAARSGWCWPPPLVGSDAAADSPIVSGVGWIKELPGSAALRTRVWLLLDPTDVAACTERALAACRLVASPFPVEEWRWPADLAPAARAALLGRTVFVEPPPASLPDRAPAFRLTWLDVREPFPVVVWQATAIHAAPDRLDELQVMQAMLAAGAPAGFWLLPPPLDGFDLTSLERRTPVGTVLVPCVNLRAGAQHAIALHRAATPATPARCLSTIEIAPGLACPGYRLHAAEIAAAVRGVRVRPAPRDFAGALADWQAGRGTVVDLAAAYLATKQWRKNVDPSGLRARLAVESSATPAAFAANLFGQLPLCELFDQPSERARAVAGLVRALLPDAPAERPLRHLAAAVAGDAETFAREAAATAGDWRAALAARTLAWLARLPGPLAPLPVAPPEVATTPAEALLGGAAASLALGHAADTQTLLDLLARHHPDVFLRSANAGRWNRHLLWAGVCRRAGDPARAAAALRWAEATDATVDEQRFLLARDPACPPADLRLPDLAMPGVDRAALRSP